MVSYSAQHVVTAVLATALILLSCAVPAADATSGCDPPNKCDDSCPAWTVVNECINFIGNLEDVADLDADDAVDGELTFRQLRVVTGDIDFDFDGVARFSFPKLLVTGGNFTFDDLDDVEAIDAPLLKQVGEFEITDMDKLERLVFPSLQQVDGTFDVSNNTVLTYISFPLLKASSNDFAVNDNPELREANFPLFAIHNGDDDDGIQFVNDDKLQKVSFPSLQTISAAGLLVESNDKLKIVDFPKLKYTISDEDPILIEENPELKLINIPALQSVFEVDINNNDDLRVANVGSNLEAGTIIGNSVDVNNNPELRLLNMAGVKGIYDELLVEDNDKLRWISAKALQSVGDEIDITGNALAGLWLPSLKVVGEGIEISDDEEIKFISMPSILDMDVDNGDGLEVFDTPELEVISAISMRNGDELELDGNGLGDLRLVNFPSMKSNTGEILLGDADPVSDSFKGTAFFPQLLAVKDGVVADPDVNVVAPKLVNHVDDASTLAVVARAKKAAAAAMADDKVDDAVLATTGDKLKKDSPRRMLQGGKQ